MKYIKNIFYLTFPLFLGIISGLITNNSIDYSDLIKPPFSPPDIVFPIVWTILYILIGLSYYLYKKNGETNIVEEITYYLQLFLNFTWTIIFFTLKLRFTAIIWILALSISIYTLITLFIQKYKLSAYLLIPYLIWCLFATYLTIGIYLLN